MSLTRKKNVSLIAAGIFSLLLSTSSTVSAHNFWVNVSTPDAGKVLTEIGYGHDFPNPEVIPEDRLHIFESPRLIGSDKTYELQQKGENYAYEGNETLKKGSYIATSLYRPTFWSNGPDGWRQQNLVERPDATYSEEVAMYAKTIFNVDGCTSKDFSSKPVGQKLEIVPLENPATIRPGQVLPLQVLLDGKPLKTAKITGTFGGFCKGTENKAFSGTTDLKGKIDFVPLKEGFWFINTEHVAKHEDQTKAEDMVLIATLTFQIN